MATHDYVIANGTGAAVRSDLNDALAAIVSNNSSSTEPGTTYAYQWWADTNADQLKIRNSANNGWIVLRELDGTMLLENGSAASPALSFASDTDTGIYRPTANELGIATGGTQRVRVANTVTAFNEGGNDVNFRVESDNQSNMLFVDGGEDRIGIGTGTPATKLHVVSSGEDQIRIADGTRAAALGSTGSINFVGSITAAQGFAFYSANEERMRLVSNGRFLINTSTARSNFFNSTVSPQVQLEGAGDFDRQMSITSSATADARGAILILAHQKSGAAGGNTVVAAGTTCGRLSFQGSDGTQFCEAAKIQVDVDGTPGADDMPGRIEFATTSDGSAGPTERMRLQSNGYLHTSNNTTDSEYYASATNHLYHQDTGSRVVMVLENSGNSNPGGMLIDFTDDSPDDNTAYFIKGQDNTTNRFYIWSDGDLDNHDNSYGAISDQKLKQDVVDAGSQWDDLKDLRVRKFKFKSDVATYGDQAKTLIGLVAQEAETVCPGLVKNNPDLDEEGNDLGTVTKSVRYSVLYMKAIKALQEAMNRIETLEAKVAALEAG